MPRFVTHPGGSISLVGDREHDIDRMSRFFVHLDREFGHYREILARIGWQPESCPVATLADFPPTSRADYRDILQPESLVRLNRRPFVTDYSSGTSGRCVLRLATPGDELAEQAITEEVFRRAGMRGGDTFVCADVGFPEIYDFYTRAAKMLGVRRSTFLHLNRDHGRSLEPIRRLAPDVFLTLPSLLARCWPHLKEMWPYGQSPIRSLIFMGEPMPPRFREEVAATLGCGVYSFYGTTESGGLAGECKVGDGCHFDPSLVGATLDNPTRLDDETAQGELLLTTWHLRDAPVVKYRVGDVVRITTKGCECGDPSPRLTVLERTHEGFVIAGLKLHYQTVLDALAAVAGPIDDMSITLGDLPESEGHTLLRVDLPGDLESRERELLDVLKYRIFELDDLFQFGVVRFAFRFVAADPSRRKIRRVIDRRKYLGDDE